MTLSFSVAPGFLERCRLLSSLDGFLQKLPWRVSHSENCSSQGAVLFKAVTGFVIMREVQGSGE